MSVFREEGRLVVVVPARMSAAQRQRLIPGLVADVLAKEARRGAPRGEEALTAHARALFERHLSPQVDAPGVRSTIPDFGVRWVRNQNTRWGSCTPSTGEIRLNERLRDMPPWVVDYVLVHELTHLIEARHSARFRALIAAYPDGDRAQAFLDGYLHARRHAGPELEVPESLD